MIYNHTIMRYAYFLFYLQSCKTVRVILGTCDVYIDFYIFLLGGVEAILVKFGGEIWDTRNLMDIVL